MCCSGDAGESAGRRGSRIGDLAIPAQVTRGPRSRTCCRNNRTHLCTNSSHVSSSAAGYRRDRRGTSAFRRHRQTNLGSSRPIPTSVCHLLFVRATGYSHLYRLATTTTASFASISSSSGNSNSNSNSNNNNSVAMKLVYHQSPDLAIPIVIDYTCYYTYHLTKSSSTTSFKANSSLSSFYVTRSRARLPNRRFTSFRTH